MSHRTLEGDSLAADLKEMATAPIGIDEMGPASALMRAFAALREAVDSRGERLAG